MNNLHKYVLVGGVA